MHELVASIYFLIRQPPIDFIAFRWNSVTGGDDGVTGWKRQALDLGLVKIDLLGNDKAFY